MCAGIAPGGTHANWRFLADWVSYDGLTKEEQLILCEAHSGGLLAAIPPERAGDAVRELTRAGAPCRRRDRSDYGKRHGDHPR